MREAPDVEQFAQRNSQKANIVSIGFTADAAMSKSFSNDYGLTTPVALVDQSSQVARHYGVNSHPSWIVIDSNGERVDSGTRFDDKVQAALDSAT